MANYFIYDVFKVQGELLHDKMLALKGFRQDGVKRPYIRQGETRSARGSAPGKRPCHSAASDVVPSDP